MKDQPASSPEPARPLTDAEFKEMRVKLAALLTPGLRRARRERRFRSIWWSLGAVLYTLALPIIVIPLIAVFVQGFAQTSFYRWYEVIGGIISLLAIIHVCVSIWLQRRRDRAAR